MAYFSYHAIHGDRGLTAWWALRHGIEEVRTELAMVSAERQRLEHRVRLLRDDHLHPDMLDERARGMLNLIGPDELVILTPQAAPSDALDHQVR